MAQGFHLLTLLFTLILGLQPGKAPVSSDWHKRYGQPEAERYALSNGFILTVSYSATAQTCKASIEPAKAQSRAVFEGALNEIVPAAERGKELRSIDLSNLVGFTQYELVTVSLYPVSRESYQEIKSAAVYWNGIQCKGSDQQGSVSPSAGSR